jgi:hypothetical protein
VSKEKASDSPGCMRPSSIGASLEFSGRMRPSSARYVGAFPGLAEDLAGSLRRAGQKKRLSLIVPSQFLTFQIICLLLYSRMIVFLTSTVFDYPRDSGAIEIALFSLSGIGWDIED